MRLKSLLLVSLAVLALVVVGRDTSRGQEGAVSDEENASSKAVSDEEAQRIQIGFQISPVKMNLRHQDKDLVGLGSYLVNANSFCSDCHTSPPWVPGHNPHLGQPAQINTAVFLAGGLSFGPVVSRNITPEANGLPAGMTLSQFLLVMRTGIDLDNLHPQLSKFLLVMPWPQFHNLTRHELEAIYAYLSTIPHAFNPDAPPQ
jgi:hypothetical protein